MATSSNKPILKICSEMNLITHRFDYELVIDKFKSVRKDGFRSELFSPPGRNEPKFYIEYSPKPENSSYKIITLFVCEKHSNIYVKFDIKLLDEYDVPDTVLFKSKALIEFSQLSKSILLGELWNPPGFPGDKLKILCEFTFEIDSFATQSVMSSFESSINSKVKTFQGYHRLSPSQQAALDVDTILECGKFSDVEIVIGKRSFRAHKFILAARSPVFEAMFQHDFEESQTNRVEIIDIDEGIFEHLLRYIYANIAPPNDSNADQLLAAADKYQLKELKDSSENRLISKLNDETMYDMLLLADTFNAAKLKEAAIKYISSRFSNFDRYNVKFNSAVTKLFQNHLSSNMIEALRNFENDVKSLNN